MQSPFLKGLKVFGFHNFLIGFVITCNLVRHCVGCRHVWVFIINFFFSILLQSCKESLQMYHMLYTYSTVNLLFHTLNVKLWHVVKNNANIISKLSLSHRKQYIYYQNMYQCTSIQNEKHRFLYWSTTIQLKFVHAYYDFL